jgi:NAD(P)-dependent dehydrogenase (short-subunit alcohol dehydrogenase family)
MSQNSSKSLEGKTVVVTGGTLGIGRATAEACLRAGAKVFICSRTRGDVEQAVQEMSSLGTVRGLSADVTDEKRLDKMFAELKESLGLPHVVIHCAGVYGPIGNILEVDPTAWWEAIRINLFGTFLVARKACEAMKPTGGRIVLFSGGGAASPFPRYTSYACGKVGVVRLCETLAMEMAEYNIAVNAIAPGFVLTRFHQQTLDAGKLAGDFLEKTKAEIAKGGTPATKAADLAVFLASDASEGINGKFISAAYDDYRNWKKEEGFQKEKELFTLRRIIPKDRGMKWQ